MNDLKERVARSKESKKRLFSELSLVQEERRVKNRHYKKLVSSAFGTLPDQAEKAINYERQ